MIFHRVEGVESGAGAADCIVLAAPFRRSISGSCGLLGSTNCWASLLRVAVSQGACSRIQTGASAGGSRERTDIGWLWPRATDTASQPQRGENSGAMPSAVLPISSSATSFVIGWKVPGRTSR